jgi:hypothetical protein
MDNEPSLWCETHRDVHPIGPTMEKIKNTIIDYGGKVKATDPSAIVVGPEEWGWPAYLYSGYDWQWAGAHNNYNPGTFPDRSAHGGMDYLPWVLDQVRQHDLQTGQRSLDVFTVHWYPQGGEAFSNDVSPTMTALRNRSTRSLWDPTYTDQSWINNKVYVIPRMRNWVNQYYPGLQVGVTEYNWGAEGFMNGATAQADVYGIFGREGLDMATRWTTPADSTPTYKAMKLYRNYDGNKSTFGDISVADSVPDPDTLSSFAAVRAKDNALTIMVINKSSTAGAAANINVANFPTRGLAQVWQLTSTNAITRLNDLTIAGSSFNLNVPAQSITLLVIAGAAPILYTEQNSQRALAMDSVNLLHDPFPFSTDTNFSSDHLTRISVLAGNVDLNGDDPAAVVTALAEDSQNNPYPMTVEYAGKVPGYDWLTQVVLKFSNQGLAAGDYRLTVSLRNAASNKAFVTMKQ